MKKKLIVLFTAVILVFCLAVTASAYAKGDVDNSGKVNVADARLCLRQAVHLDSCEDGGDVFKACDVNRDGGITVADARLILRVAVALDKPFTEDEEETTIPEETTAAHVHSWDEGTVTKAATCSATGVKTYKCSCGETKTEEIAINPDAHSYEAVTVAATCTSDGYTGRKCKLCGNVIKDTVLLKDAKAHKYETVEVKANCLDDGYSIEKCAYCGDIKADTYKKTADALGHDYKTETIAATCTEAAKIVKTCQRENCGAVDITYDETQPATGHNYSYKTTVKATCTKEGLKTGVCSVCGATTTVETARKAHNFEADVIITADPSDSTKTICATQYKCSNSGCGYILKTVYDKGHQWRNVDDSYKEATCTEAGTREQYCQNCDKTQVIVVEDALGHDADIVSQTAATCTTAGSVVYSGSCKRCGENLGAGATVTIPEKGHVKNREYATCIDNIYCTRCNEEIEPALGHDYTISVTGAYSGSQYFYCTRCGELRTDTLDTLNKMIRSHTTSYLYKQTSSSTYSKFDFGMYTNTVKSLYEDEMDSDTATYTPFYENRYSYFSSKLTADNIDSINVEHLNSITGNAILSGFDSKYTLGSKEYSLEQYKNDTNLSNGDGVIKVTVDVKDDILKKNGGNVDYNNESYVSNLEKLYYPGMDSKITADLKEYDSNWQHTETEGSSDEGYSITMNMTLQEIKENCTVIYYFNAKTMEPIAANYIVTKTVDQLVGMKMTVGVMNINGTIEPVITTTTNYVYFF